MWAPAARGRWPVVYAVPGVSGHKEDYEQLGPALAEQGMVVFATDYPPDGTAQELVGELVCGYRYALSVAGRYGADLRQPLTGVGYSNGARLVGAILDPTIVPSETYAACPDPAPAPDVAVGVAGCYFTHHGIRTSFTVPQVSPDAVRLLLVSGQDDHECAPWQSAKATRQLSGAGFRVTHTSIPGATHYTLTFHDMVGGAAVTLRSSPAGRATVQAIVDAVRSAR